MELIVSVVYSPLPVCQIGASVDKAVDGVSAEIWSGGFADAGGFGSAESGGTTTT